MAGLLDFLDTDEAKLGLQMLAAGGYSPTRMSTGQRIAGAMQNFQGMRDADMRRQLLKSQMQENEVQNEVRRASIARAAQQQAFDQQFLGGGGLLGALEAPRSSAPGAGATMASSGGGVTGEAPASVPGAPPSQPVGVGQQQGGQQSGPMTARDIAQRFNVPYEAVVADYRFNGGKKIAELINERTKPNWVNVNGNLVNTAAPGFAGGVQGGVSAGNDGRVTQWMPNGRGGLVVGAPEGAIDTYRAYQDVGNRSQASFTPGRPTILPGGRMGGQSQLSEIEGPRTPFARLPAPQAGVTGNFQGDPAAVAAAIAAIGDPQERANAQAAFEQQMRAPGGTREVSGGGLEFSPQEKAGQDADRARQVKTAEADVGRDTARLADIKTANRFLSTAKQVRDVFNDGPTDSGIGSLIDSGAAFIGVSPKGAQAAARLKALGGWLVSNVPRMEGPQSNFDVANYQVMAADVANDKLPLDRRKAALDSIVQMLEGVANPGAAPAPRTAAAGTAEQPVSRLKTAPSEADIRNTALKYGMTVEQVKQRLGVR
ncbi:hypothetical protein DBV14_09475 [Variovorax sp. KBW07]|uniref:hypothetical protein n=1 Tax=Variovorax sp. KBW07 TaxID=2153358 RepID=UPI000F57BFB6|nr:hypothetical protein [Variovorax sp. KBW07]RQO57029.1 hypothetical protein DBV14_09475 [Variovorax sp. KBW07]